MQEEEITDTINRPFLSGQLVSCAGLFWLWNNQHCKQILLLGVQ